MKTMDDQQLITIYLTGDNKAFETLLLRHKNRIFRFILMKIKDRDLADDIFQETFVKIINTLQLGKYNEEGNEIGFDAREKSYCTDRIKEYLEETFQID